MSEQSSKERNKKLRELYGSTKQPPKEKTVTERLVDWWEGSMTYEGRVKRKR